MLAEELARKTGDAEYKGTENPEITGISYNSKTTRPGDIFVCLKGENSDGHGFAKSAVENGAAALMCEKVLDVDVPQIIVKSTNAKIADLSAAFYENPSKKLNLIGVTGTNGKTTVTHLLQKIFEAAGEKCALIGTLGCKFSSGDEYINLHHTTPQAPDLQKVLKETVDRGIKTAVTEVSSHALAQNRVGGCEFKTAVLTNLTQDHLDYHITMNNYFEAKALLFKGLKPGGNAVVNADDEYAQRFIDAVPDGVKIYTYSINNPSDFKAEDIKFDETGISYTLHGRRIKLHLNGLFSVYNTLAAIATAKANGIDEETIVATLEATRGVAGRFETIVHKPLVIVDYAHTPDGLQNVLKTAKALKKANSKLICLFGCGGDRDATKRPKMGRIAEELADMVVVTSDNPRSEDPGLIISDIMAGFKTVNPDNVAVEPDRGKAIGMLKKIAKPDDIVVVAGKGHEDYQILKDKTIKFDDREEVRKTFEE